MCATRLKKNCQGQTKGFFRVQGTHWGRNNCKIKLKLSCLVARRLYFFQKRTTFWSKFPSWGIWPIWEFTWARSHALWVSECSMWCLLNRKILLNRYFRKAWRHLGAVWEKFQPKATPKYGHGHACRCDKIQLWIMQQTFFTVFTFEYTQKGA